jgi:hypothetical protein
MASEMKSMRGVYIHYWDDGASSMIFASDSDAEPTNRYSSHANPGQDLINEVLDKVKANNNGNVPIELRIENDSFIVAENAVVAARPQVMAMAGPESLQDVEGDKDESTATNKPAPKPKSAPTKRGAKRTSDKKAEGKKPATKKPADLKSKAKSRKR